MDNQEALQRTLNRARRALQIIEEEKASYGIRIPPDLVIELEEKQKEVTSTVRRKLMNHYDEIISKYN